MPLEYIINLSIWSSKEFLKNESRYVTRQNVYNWSLLISTCHFYSNCQPRLQIVLHVAIIWFFSPNFRQVYVTSLNIIKSYVVHFIVIASPVLLLWNSLTVLVFPYFFLWENGNWDLAHLEWESNQKPKAKGRGLWSGQNV